MKYIQFISVVVFILGMIGCSNDSTMTTMETQQPRPFTIAPSDGSTNVRLDAPISFTFIKPVDRTITERSIHLISERAMADSLCPVSNTMEHGTMNMAMMDSMNMNHLMSQHRTPGKFSWNDDSTQCTFKPDSMMMSNMQYMVHIGQEMMQMMSNRMGNMGMTDGHGTGKMSNDMMYHYRTMDTTQASGGGHDGHHL